MIIHNILIRRITQPHLRQHAQHQSRKAEMKFTQRKTVLQLVISKLGKHTLRLQGNEMKRNERNLLHPQARSTPLRKRQHTPLHLLSALIPLIQPALRRKRIRVRERAFVVVRDECRHANRIPLRNNILNRLFIPLAAVQQAFFSRYARRATRHAVG